MPALPHRIPRLSCSGENFCNCNDFQTVQSVAFFTGFGNVPAGTMPTFAACVALAKSGLDLVTLLDPSAVYVTTNAPRNLNFGYATDIFSSAYWCNFIQAVSIRSAMGTPQQYINDGIALASPYYTKGTGTVYGSYVAANGILTSTNGYAPFPEGAFDPFITGLVKPFRPAGATGIDWTGGPDFETNEDHEYFFSVIAMKSAVRIRKLELINTASATGSGGGIFAIFPTGYNGSTIGPVANPFSVPGEYILGPNDVPPIYNFGDILIFNWFDPFKVMQ